MLPTRKKEFSPHASNLEGYDLTRHLEADPRFLEMLAIAHDGWENLPGYLRIRYAQINERGPAKT